MTVCKRTRLSWGGAVDSACITRVISPAVLATPDGECQPAPGRLGGVIHGWNLTRPGVQVNKALSHNADLAGGSIFSDSSIVQAYITRPVWFSAIPNFLSLLEAFYKDHKAQGARLQCKPSSFIRCSSCYNLQKFAIYLQNQRARHSVSQKTSYMTACSQPRDKCVYLD